MKVFLSSKADRQLNKLPRKMHQLLISHIEKLKDQPFRAQSRKLTGRDGYRMRVGDYRILYTVSRAKKEVTIMSVAHRREAYRV